jgi:hypothetical protein
MNKIRREKVQEWKKLFGRDGEPPPTPPIYKKTNK